MISKFKQPAFHAATVLAGVMMANAAFAQDAVQISLSDVSVVNDGSIAVSLDFVGNGESSGFDADINYDGTGIADIDLTDCLEGSNTALPNCVFPGGGDASDGVIRITLFQDESIPLEDFTGTLVFDLDGTLNEGDVIDLVFDPASLDANSPAADVEDTPGSITILGEPVGPESDLSIAPAAINFGTVDLGNMPQSDVFTITAGGDADADDVNITNVDLAGDAEFSIGADSCSGAALPVGDSCDVEIVFDAAADGTFAGTLTVDSDADNNPTVSGDIEGSAGSAPDLDVNPAFGPVNLGTAPAGEILTANGTVTNNGSADGTFSCDLTGDAEISVDPDLSAGVTLGAGEDVGFSLSCALPADADVGTTFSATLACDGDLTGTHELSCSVGDDTPAIPVTTMQPWALALFALMMLMVGGISIRFFRAS